MTYTFVDDVVTIAGVTDAREKIKFSGLAQETNRRLGLIEDDVLDAILGGNTLLKTDMGGYTRCLGAIRRDCVIGADYVTDDDGTMVIIRTMVIDT